MSTRSIIHVARVEDLSQSSEPTVIATMYKHWDGYPQDMGNGWWLYHFNAHRQELKKENRLANFSRWFLDPAAELVHYFQSYGRDAIEMEGTPENSASLWNTHIDLDYIYLYTVSDKAEQLKIWEHVPFSLHPNPGTLIFDGDPADLPSKFDIPDFSPKERLMLHNDDADLTADICARIVRCYPEEIEYVPQRFSDFSFVSQVVQAIKPLSKEYKSYFWTRMPETYLRFSPDGRRQERLVAKPLLNRQQQELLARLAQKKQDLAWTDIPAKCQTEDFLRELIRLNAAYFKHLPDESKTLQMAFSAVRQDGDNLQYVPENLKLAAVVKRAIQQNPASCAYLGSNFDAEARQPFLELALKKSKYNLNLIPKEWLNESLCLFAVAANPLMLAYVPDKMKTWSVCYTAYYKDRRDFFLTKEELDEVILHLPNWLKKDGVPLSPEEAYAEKNAQREA